MSRPTADRAGGLRPGDYPLASRQTQMWADVTRIPTDLYHHAGEWCWVVEGWPRRGTYIKTATPSHQAVAPAAARSL